LPFGFLILPGVWLIALGNRQTWRA
jgi:hypothetical protein